VINSRFRETLWNIFITPVYFSSRLRILMLNRIPAVLIDVFRYLSKPSRRMPGWLKLTRSISFHILSILHSLLLTSNSSEHHHHRSSYNSSRSIGPLQRISIGLCYLPFCLGHPSSSPFPLLHLILFFSTCFSGVLPSFFFVVSI
jgi:hypothetical protein